MIRMNSIVSLSTVTSTTGTVLLLLLYIIPSMTVAFVVTSSASISTIHPTSIIEVGGNSPSSSSVVLLACRDNNNNDTGGGGCSSRRTSKKACQSPCPLVMSEEKLLLSPPEDFHTLKVWYEGLSCDVLVHREETILEAMERQSVMDQLCITQLPASCRRGNCLTCVGRVLRNTTSTSTSTTTNTSTKDTLSQHHHTTNDDCSIAEELRLFRNIRRGEEDGLPPQKSEKLRFSDQFLTCSSYITGPDVSIILGDNEDGMAFLPGRKDDDDDDRVERLKLAAIAKVFRIHAEQDIQTWKAETEQILFSNEEEEEEEQGI